MRSARTAVVPTTPEGALPAWGRVARALRVALVLGWLVMAGLIAAVGARDSTFDDLERAVLAGEVDEVTVDGGLDPAGTGFATVRVTWRDGLLSDTTEVVEARPLAAARDAGGEGVTARLDLSVAERLGRLDPEVEVRQVARSTSTLDAEVPRWHLPGWAVWPLLAVVVATVLAIGGSPAPWWATRWAWFWLVGSGPVGLAAYLLLAGPLPGLGSRLAARPRLTGGWAFLLATGLWVLTDR